MIYLHIGMHKTGTTMFQQVCEMMDDKLKAKGVSFYPFLSYIGQLLQHNSPLVEGALVELKNGFKKILHDTQTEHILISSEGFMGNPWQGYRNVEAVTEDAYYIFGEFQPICVLRDQDEWVYSQAIKEGQTFSFQELIDSLRINDLWWQDRLKFYSGCKTLKYSKNVVHDLLDVVGCNLEFPEFGANFSLNKQGIELAKLVSPHLDADQMEHFRAFLERDFIKAPGVSFGFFDEATRKTIREYYELTG